jgi:hypothetical protein
MQLCIRFVGLVVGCSVVLSLVLSRAIDSNTEPKVKDGRAGKVGL